MPTLPPVILFDLDDTLLDYSTSGNQCWQEICLEYAPHFGVSAEQLSTVLQQTSDWYWSDPERHRAGHHNLRDARRRVLQLTLEKLGDNRLVGVGHLYAAERLDPPADAHVLDTREFEMRQALLDGTALRVEDPLLGKDVDGEAESGDGRRVHQAMTSSWR